jgi:hypothetical protein
MTGLSEISGRIELQVTSSMQLREVLSRLIKSLELLASSVGDSESRKPSSYSSYHMSLDIRPDAGLTVTALYLKDA